MLILKGGTVITGDGKAVMENANVFVDGGWIVDVTTGSFGATGSTDHVIDVSGRLVIPGIVNPHAHGVGFGPLFATAAAPLPRDQVLKNLDRQLRNGTTSIVNMDGFALPEEIAETNRAHPVNVFLCTTHMPINKEVALIADAAGMTPAHHQLTAEQAVAAGAVMFAEIGGGHTLGGGGQDYMYIPMAVKVATGVELNPSQARKLKEAVLSRFIRADAYDEATVAAVLRELGLAERLTPEMARDLIENSVLPSFQKSLDGFAEGAKYAERFGLPTLVHNSAPSSEATHAMAERIGPLLIAGHTNHSTYTLEESLASARFLRRHESIVEVCVLDAFGAAKLERDPSIIFALLAEDLVDTLGTDYAGGNWDNTLFGIERMVAQKAVSLPKAIGMATCNVVRAIPRLGERGLVAPGKIADLVVTSMDHLSQIDMAFIDGRLVYRDGKTLYGETAQQ